MNKILRFLAHTAPLAALLVGALPAHALYKVVGPDGQVTYTDRPPASASASDKVTPIESRGAAQSEVALPLELRQAVARYPVTLYTASACSPCEAARQLLRQRGIPYTEKLVVTAEDAEAFQRLTGGLEAPALTIGAQALRGLSTEVWNSYLDSAGYPRESRLPANYQFSTATPITQLREVVPQVRAPAAPVTPTPQTTAQPASPSGIRF